MTASQDDPQDMNPAAASHPDTVEPKPPTGPGEGASTGASGEGSSSAMARLISQEQSRIVPGVPADASPSSS